VCEPQVLTPAVTLAICATFGLERLTGSLFVSILMITLGTGVATAVEVGVAGFAWPGFLSFLFSTVLEAVRVVYIQLLLGSLNYNSMEVCPTHYLKNWEQASPPANQLRCWWERRRAYDMLGVFMCRCWCT
jgi:hypothetical protein